MISTKYRASALILAAVVVASVPGSADILDTLLGRQTAQPGDDANSDLVVDSADVVTTRDQITAAPNPREVAPPLNPSLATPFCESIRFLYEGAPRIQRDVTPGAVLCDEVAVIRGVVLDEAGDPFPAVEVRALGRPEFGYTTTREDGGFEFVVNGGSQTSLTFAASGVLPAQRSLLPLTGVYTPLGDPIMLVALSEESVEIDLTQTEDPFQIAQGPVITDDGGTRQSVLLFPAGVEATIRTATGNETASRLTVRQTEYTVGANGPMRMPASLPPQTGYNYCIELSADEADPAFARAVEFNPPLINYVENVIGAPAGTRVPSGFFNRETGLWEAAPDGLCVLVLSEEGGLAVLDLDGDGSADPAENLIAWGISDDERREVARLYEPGKSLARVPIAHFTPWDFNYPWGPPLDAIGPDGKRRVKVPRNFGSTNAEEDCTGQGSSIAFLSRTLAKTITVPGSGVSLAWNSNSSARRPIPISIPATGDEALSANLREVGVRFTVAGQTNNVELPPLNNQTAVFQWDGRDAYGRAVVGTVKGSATVSYGYVPTYYGMPFGSVTSVQGAFQQSFGRLGGGLNFTSIRVGGEQRVQVVRRYDFVVGPLSPVGQLTEDGSVSTTLIKGWGLNELHHYLPDSRTVLLGTGDSYKAAASYRAEALWQTTAQDPTALVDGSTLAEAGFGGIRAMDYGPNGDLYLLCGYVPQTNQALLTRSVLRITPAGVVTIIAGGRSSNVLRNAQGLAVGPDGTVYVSRPDDHLVMRIPPGGIAEVFAGTGSLPAGIGTGVYPVDEFVPAATAEVPFPSGIDVAPDGTVYILTAGRIRRVDPSGIISTVLGDGAPCASGGCMDDVPASEARLPNSSGGSLMVDGAGNVIFSATYSGSNFLQLRSIRRINSDGTVEQVMGLQRGNNPDSTMVVGALVAQPDGTIFTTVGSHLFRIPSGTFTVENVHGTTGLPRNTNPSQSPWSLESFNVGGSILTVANDGDVRALYNSYTGGDIIPPFTYLRLRLADLGGGINALGGRSIPSREGTLLYDFDDAGRHRRTRLIPTMAVVLEFEYDPKGRLAAIVRSGVHRTTVNRDTAGVATSLTLPDGRAVSLEEDATGRLSRVDLPNGESHLISYDAEGLITRYEDPRGLSTDYTYDDASRLETITASDGTTMQLATTIDEEKVLEVAVQRNGRFHASYRREEVPSDNQRATRVILTTTDAAGNVTTTDSSRNGGRRTTLADGTSILQVEGLPGTGPIASNQPVRSEVTTPSGRKNVSTFSRIDTLTGQDLTVRQETLVQDGVSSVYTYSRSTPGETLTVPGIGTVSYLHDAEGRVISTQAEDLAPITAAYNAAGQITRLTQGEAQEDYAWDAANRLTSITNPAGESMAVEYGEDNRLAALTLTGGRRYEYQYGPGGDLLLLRMPEGGEYRFTVDDRGRPIEFTPPGSTQPFRRIYGPDGLLQRLVRPSGLVRSLTHDATRRLRSITIPGATTTFEYGDGEGGLCCGQGAAITSADRLTSEGISQSIAFEYDGPFLTRQIVAGATSAVTTHTYSSTNQRLSTTTVIDGTTINRVYTYDPATRLRATDDGFTITRGPLGAPTAVTEGTFRLENAYDESLRLTDRAISSNGLVWRHLLQLDSSKRVEAFFDLRQTVRYGYDGPFMTVSPNEQGPATSAYDLNTNPILLEGAEQRFNAADQLISSNGVAHVHDEDGALAIRGEDSFEYDGDGYLRSASLASGEVIVYTYDPLGRLTRRDSSLTGTRRFYYSDPDWQFRVTETRDGDGPVRSYHYLEDGSLIAVREGITTWYVAVAPNRVPQFVVTATGVTVRQVRSTVWGRVMTDTNPGFYLPVGIAGGIPDPSTGFVRLGHRDYDPGTGRFTTRDPALFQPGTTNLYGYTPGNPATYMDPTGLFSFELSAYRGIGAGLKVGLDSEGVSLCGEAGVGLGGGIDINFFGAADKDGSERGIELSGKLGPGGASITSKWKPCGDSWTYDSTSAKAGVGPVGYSTEDGFFSPLDWGPWYGKGAAGVENPGTNATDSNSPKDAGKLGGKLEGKVYQKKCYGKSW